MPCVQSLNHEEYEEYEEYEAIPLVLMRGIHPSGSHLSPISSMVFFVLFVSFVVR